MTEREHGGRPQRRARGGPQTPDQGPAPARGYRWAPFTDGNVVALVHGARSPRMVAPIAEQIAEALPRVAPWTRAEAFRSARESFAWTEAQAMLLRAWLDEHGLLDEDGTPRPAVATLDRAEARLVGLRGELALTPSSMARLLGVLASTAVTAGADPDALDALRAEGARILAARGFALDDDDLDDEDGAA